MDSFLDLDLYPFIVHEQWVMFALAECDLMLLSRVLNKGIKVVRYSNLNFSDSNEK